MNGKHQNECKPFRKKTVEFLSIFPIPICGNIFLIFSKYPAYLTVTVGSYQPETTCSVSLTRPMSVLEEETTGDIYTCASDGDDPINEQSHQVVSNSATEKPAQNHRNSPNRNEAKILAIKSRLPGQVLKLFPSLKISNSNTF